jgi:hypothetical protein
VMLGESAAGDGFAGTGKMLRGDDEVDVDRPHDDDTTHSDDPRSP